MAQMYVNKCDVGYGGTSGGDNIARYLWIGQNYAYFDADYRSQTVPKVVDMWFSEEKDYFYSDNWCENCGNYTQVSDKK